MIADRGKKSKVADEQDSEHIDAELVLSIEKLQEVQDQLDKVSLFAFEFFLITLSYGREFLIVRLPIDIYMYLCIHICMNRYSNFFSPVVIRILFLELGRLSFMFVHCPSLRNSE